MADLSLPFVNLSMKCKDMLADLLKTIEPTLGTAVVTTGIIGVLRQKLLISALPEILQGLFSRGLGVLPGEHWHPMASYVPP